MQQFFCATFDVCIVASPCLNIQLPKHIGSHIFQSLLRDAPLPRRTGGPSQEVPSGTEKGRSKGNDGDGEGDGDGDGDSHTIGGEGEELFDDPHSPVKFRWGIAGYEWFQPRRRRCTPTSKFMFG